MPDDSDEADEEEEEGKGMVMDWETTPNSVFMYRS